MAELFVPNVIMFANEDGFGVKVVGISLEEAQGLQERISEMVRELEAQATHSEVI